MKKAVLIAFLFGVLLADAKVKFIKVKQLKTWERMLQLAKDNGKTLLVYVEAYPCEECKTMTQTTFKDDELSDYIRESSIALQIPNYSDVGQAVVNVFGIEEAPHLMLLNAREDLFFKHSGVIAADKLLSELKKANTKARNYPIWQMAIANNKIRKLDWIKYMLVEHYNDRMDSDNEMVKRASRTLEKSDFDNPIVQQFVFELGLSTDGTLFQTVKEHPEWVDTTYFDWERYFANVFDYNMTKAIAAKDSILMEDYLFQMSQLPKTVVMYRLPLRGRQLFLAETNNWRGYDSLTVNHLRALPNDSANAYQREALTLMDSYVYQTPQKIALRYLKMGLDRKETFELYYTLSLRLISDEEWVSAYKAAYNAYQIAEDEPQQKMAARLMYYLDGGY